MFAFSVGAFAVVSDAAEDEAGFDFDLDVFGDNDVDATEESEGFNHGIFGEFGVTKV